VATIAGKSPVARSLGWALAALACLTALTGCIEFALFGEPSPAPTWLLDMFPAAGLVYAAAGVIAWWRRPSNGTGVILLLGAVSWLVAGLANTSVPDLEAAGTVTATLPVAVVVHLLLAFPSGQLRSWQARALTAAGYFTALVLQIPLYLFVPQASPGGMLAVASCPDLAHAGELVQDAFGGAGMIVVVAWLASRIWQADAARRRILLPLYTYSIVAILIVPLWPDVLEPLTDLSVDARVTTQVGVLAGVPLVFAAAVLAGRFARMAEVQELGAWLGVAEPGRPPLTSALARALGDDSVALAFWVPARNGYVDAQGSPVSLPAGDGQRAFAEVMLGGQPVGAITYDPHLIADAELVRAAGNVIAIAVDRERLTAELLSAQGELLASQDALRLSRARLAEAADAERRRIAQDLHDGLQAKLVLLAVEAQRIGASGLRGRLDDAATELSELVYRVMPAALIEQGLGAAAQDLADRSPLPVQLEDQLGAGPLPDHVASTAYFVLAEGVTNALRHARASALAIRLRTSDGLLFVEVSDDGIGGAAPQPTVTAVTAHAMAADATDAELARRAGLVPGQRTAARLAEPETTIALVGPESTGPTLALATRSSGFGLRGLGDRVAAAGGRLRVESPPGGGTTLIAELPCD
jgi:signal transduction histidine kinase